MTKLSKEDKKLQTLISMKTHYELCDIELETQREAIIRMIDRIEESYNDTTLEEWKAFKHIRNAIREMKGGEDD